MMHDVLQVVLILPPKLLVMFWTDLPDEPTLSAPSYRSHTRRRLTLLFTIPQNFPSSNSVIPTLTTVGVVFVFIIQLDDEASLLPRKLQAALEQALEQRNDIINQDSDSESDEGEREADRQMFLTSSLALRLRQLLAGGDAQSWCSHPTAESLFIPSTGCSTCLFEAFQIKNLRIEKVRWDLVEIPANSPDGMSLTAERCLKRIIHRSWRILAMTEAKTWAPSVLDVIQHLHT